MKFEIDRQNLEEKAKQEGIIEGERKGKQEGIIEGERKGELKEKYTIAKNLIGTLPPAEIALATGLPLSTIEELGANAKNRTFEI